MSDRLASDEPFVVIDAPWARGREVYSLVRPGKFALDGPQTAEGNVREAA